MKSKKLKCIIPSYAIEGEDFRPILKLANKNDASWNYPTHIVNLLTNPLPLLLFDEIYIDKTAFEGTLNCLSDRSGKTLISELLEKIGALPQIKLYNASKYIGPNVKHIFNAMKKDERNKEFEWCVDVIGKFEGNYAYPDNYHFELINMNITTTLMNSLGNAIPYDQYIRSILYELKANAEIKTIDKIRTFSKRIQQVRSYHIARPPISIKNINTIEQIGKDHCSRSTKALRAKFKKAMFNQDDFDNFIEHELTYSQNTPSEVNDITAFYDIITTLGLGYGAYQQEGSARNFFMAIFAITGTKLLYNLKKLMERDKYLWYEGLLKVLEYVQDNREDFACSSI